MNKEELNNPAGSRETAGNKEENVPDEKTAPAGQPAQSETSDSSERPEQDMQADLNGQSAQSDTADSSEDSARKGRENDKMTEDPARKSHGRKLLDNNFIRLILAAALLCACAALGAGIAVIRDKSDPTSYVAEYFGKFLMQDFEGMYTYADMDGAWVTKESFVRYFRDLRLEKSIGDYTFKPLEKRDGRYFMPVRYQDEADGKKKTLNIYLEKSRDKKMPLLSHWKISLEPYLLKDISVEIPEGMSLEVDGEIYNADEGVSVSETAAGGAEAASVSEVKSAEGGKATASGTPEESTKSAAGSEVKSGEGETAAGGAEAAGKATRVYRIPALLKGEHQFRAATDYTQIDKKAELKDDDGKVVLSVSDEKVSDKYQEMIETKTEGMVKNFYAAVRSRKPASKKLRAYFDGKSKTLKQLDKAIEESRDIIYWPDVRDIDTYRLISCKFSTPEYRTKYTGDQTFAVKYSLRYDYVSSTDTSLSTSYIFQIKGSCSTVMTLKYRTDGQDIKIISMSVNNRQKKSGD